MNTGVLCNIKHLIVSTPRLHVLWWMYCIRVETRPMTISLTSTPFVFSPSFLSEEESARMRESYCTIAIITIRVKAKGFLAPLRQTGKQIGSTLRSKRRHTKGFINRSVNPWTSRMKVASYSGCNNSSSQQAFHRESAKSGAEKDVRSRSALPIFLGLCVEMNHSPVPLSLSLPTSPALLFLPFFFCFFFHFVTSPRLVRFMWSSAAVVYYSRFCVKAAVDREERGQGGA